MRRLSASIAAAGLASLTFGAGQALAQDEPGDDQSVPDEVRDFVEDNIELFVGGLLAAILILLLIVVVLQRRAKKRSESEGQEPPESEGQGPPPESTSPPAKPSRREARGRKREEKRRQREELREKRRQEASVRKEEKARLRGEASQESKEGPASAEAEEPAAPEAEKQAPKEGEEPTVPTKPDQPEKGGFFSLSPFGRRLGGGKRKSASEKPAEARPAGSSRSAVETKAPGEPRITPYAAPAPAEPPPDQDLTAEIQTVEQRLQAEKATRERALADAQTRLREVEARAEAAERRAETAERLAKLKAEEAEREQRLRRVVTDVERAEQRALEAERRAAAAERAAMEGARAAAPASAEQPQSETSSEAPAAPPPPGPDAGMAAPPAARGQLNVNDASFDDLRGLNLSVTQATRVLAYRERLGGYKSLDDLDDVPGFPQDVLSELKQRVTV
jgi:DNA uptake protein ComE-like DNA-binding protein